MTKRTDIDLKTCVDNFAVHKDKIIRTQDSRQMGAKYLNEIDLDTREECLRLCCETDNCDVFVYEEKVIYTYINWIHFVTSMGSCTVRQTIEKAKKMFNLEINSRISCKNCFGMFFSTFQSLTRNFQHCSDFSE